MTQKAEEFTSLEIHQALALREALAEMPDDDRTANKLRRMSDREAVDCVFGMFRYLAKVARAAGFDPPGDMRRAIRETGGEA